MSDFDDIDRRIVLATQEGLPLVPAPYAEVAKQAGIEPETAMARMHRLLAAGAIRRIAAVPNHFALGYRFNAMTVWDVADDRASELGRKVGGLTFVSHCYLRPRHPPEWPYNLFAMVHGRERAHALALTETIGELLGEDCLSHDVLFSVRILKKTGMRLAG